VDNFKDFHQCCQHYKMNLNTYEIAWKKQLTLYNIV
jgi:hypothetical protein